MAPHSALFGLRVQTPAILITQTSTISSVLELIVQHFLEEDTKISILSTHFEQDSSLAVFRFPKLTLGISIHDGILKTETIDNHNEIHRNVIDPLRQQVRLSINAANAGRIPKNPAALVCVVREALSTIYDFEKEASRIDSSNGALTPYQKGWRADESFDPNQYVDNPLGLDLSTVTDEAFHILKKTPEQLCEGINKAWRIVHVECVLRRDLVHRFKIYRKKLSAILEGEDEYLLSHSLPPRSKLTGSKTPSASRKKDIIDDLVSTRVTYHGTPLKNVSSIVRHGFKLPGFRLNGTARVVASPRSGIAFDRGIYSSPAPFYALSYAARGRQATPLGDIPTLRLFICATIMGRTLRRSQDNDFSKIHGPRVDGYDAHFDGPYEYIVHDTAAILPCYVIHLDLGAAVAERVILGAQKHMSGFARKQKKRGPHPKLNTLTPGEIDRAAADRKAAALKWLPNGFGPARGTNFIVVEIAATHDDEEIYGGWQAGRRGFYTDSLDRYQSHRRS